MECIGSDFGSYCKEGTICRDQPATLWKVVVKEVYAKNGGICKEWRVISLDYVNDMSYHII